MTTDSDDTARDSNSASQKFSNEMNHHMKQSNTTPQKADEGRFSKILTLVSQPDILAFLLPLTLVIPNLLLDITDTMPWWMRLVNLALPLSIYYILTAITKKIGVLTSVMFIIMALNTFQVVVLYLFGERVIAIDMFLNVVTTQPSEAAELLANLIFPLTFCALIYLSVLAWGIYAWRKKQRTSATYRRRTLRIYIPTAAASILILAAGMLSERSTAQLRNLYPYNVFSNIVTASQRINQSIKYPSTSRNFTYGAKSVRPADMPEIHILVIGETSRACNWSLYGYNRDTNPKLSCREGIVFYNRAISQSNTTHKCAPMLLSVVDPFSFDSIINRKSIITAFKEAGYRTAFFTTQPKNRSYNEYFADEADTTIFLSNHQHCDLDLAGLLKEELTRQKATKHFVVLHTYGSHFNYLDRYPKDFAHFIPDDASNATKANRPQLINAYDNTIRYTDAVLDSVIGITASFGVPATLLYVSDHGEDIFDDNRERFLHASPTPTYYQLHVPLIAWTSHEYDSIYPQVREALVENSHKYVAPSQQLFHTMIDMSGLSTEYYDPVNSFASESFSSPQPVFLNDYNEPSPLRFSGLKSQDLEIFKKLNIIQ